VVSIERRVDRVSANGEYFLHVCNAVLEDKGFAVVDHGPDTARRGYAVNITVKDLQVEEVLPSERQGVWN
jgi:predicted metallo-beta-lactamase superfamily hydrolase